MTTLNQIYALEPIETYLHIDNLLTSITEVSPDSTLPELLIIKAVKDDYSFEAYELEKMLQDEQRIQLRVYMNESTDNDKYGALLFAIYFDDQPVMLVKNSGKYFSNFDTYLSNELQFKAMLTYIVNHIPAHQKEQNALDAYDADIDLNIDKISSYYLFDYYDTNPQLKYQVGDIVWAWVEKNTVKEQYSFRDTNYVLTQVKITQLSPKLKQKPYTATQLHWIWETAYPDWKMKFDLNAKEELNTHFTEEAIVCKVGEFHPMLKYTIDHFIDEIGHLPDSYKMTVNDVIALENAEKVQVD